MEKLKLNHHDQLEHGPERPPARCARGTNASGGTAVGIAATHPLHAALERYWGRERGAYLDPREHPDVRWWRCPACTPRGAAVHLLAVPLDADGTAACSRGCAVEDVWRCVGRDATTPPIIPVVARLEARDVLGVAPSSGAEKAAIPSAVGAIPVSVEAERVLVESLAQRGCAAVVKDLHAELRAPSTRSGDRQAPALEAAHSDAANDEAPLQFMSPAELWAAIPADVAWLWDGYLARGAITLLAGKPKAGKSTLACALIEAIVTGARQFLGRDITCGPVVFVSEEGGGTLKPKLLTDDRVRVLSRDGAWPKPTWPRLLDACVQEARRVGAVLLVIDTLAFWSDLGADREKDAGAAQETMAALMGATRAGVAVLLIHHQRKAGGEDGDAIRGSTALTAGADAIVELERSGGRGSNERRLDAVSRWTTTPRVLVVERDATGVWRAIAEGTDRRDAEALSYRQRLVRAAPQHDLGATEDDLAQLVGVDRRKIGTPLRELCDEGRLIRDGAGRKGDPYRYRQAPAVSPPEAPPSLGSKLGADAPLPEGGEHQEQNLPAVAGGASGTNAERPHSSAIFDADAEGEP